jgi:hypothetical protein
MLPWYTGRSTLGLPLENDRVALLSASFITFLFLNPEHFEHLLHVACIYVASWFLARKQQVQQVVVCQIHQQVQAVGLADCEARLVLLEETLDETGRFPAGRGGSASAVC